MTYEELSSLLQFDEQFESKVFIPNEIFHDLKVLHEKGSSHIALAYTYHYLINWLYKYTKYNKVKVQLNQDKLKEILGYNPKSKTIDYIIKKNGILDNLQYTSTTTDIPLDWEYTKEQHYEGLEFSRLYDLDIDTRKLLNVPSNFRIKYPVRAFNRYIFDPDMKEDYEQGYEDGTFFEVDNTHLIPFESFLFCMSNKELGCIGFYLYSFLKSKNQLFKNGYDIPLDELETVTGVKGRTLDKYLTGLKKYNLINAIINQEYFVPGLDEEERKANTYITNDYIMFSDSPVFFKKRKVQSLKEYKKNKAAWGELEEKIDEEMDALFS